MPRFTLHAVLGVGGVHQVGSKTVEHTGYILIADITGYTVYLNESELDHAKGTLSSLLELLIDQTKPPLVISGLEGDAVFSYGLEEGFIDGQTFLETLEATYVSFRRAIELMVLNNTCECNACANVSSLDLKFFVHHGSFALQTVGDSEELIGRDVNLIHRLLKNSVTEETGITAYTLCTDAAVKALGVDQLQDELVPHVDDVPDFGRTQVWIQDMHPIYEARESEQTIQFEPSEVLWEHETEVSLPPPLIWDYLNHTEYRNLLSGADRYDLDRKGSRVGEGSVFQCYHGDRAVPQIILEWRPFERLVYKQVNPVPGPTSYIHIDLELRPSEWGTSFTCRLAKPTGATWQRGLARIVYRAMRSSIRRNIERFGTHIEQDAKRGDPLHERIPSRESISEAAETGLRSR